MRYRGYYQDTETGLYYLQSRYYDPDTCRMVNADEPELMQMASTDFVGHNMFAYCSNNPIMYTDPTGKYKYGWWDFYRSRGFIAFVIDAVIIAIIGGVASSFVGYLRILIKKYAEQRAKIIFSKVLKRKLLARGLALGFVSGIVLASVKVFNYLVNKFDPGKIIFDYVDARDKRPHSGYLDF